MSFYHIFLKIAIGFAKKYLFFAIIFFSELFVNTDVDVDEHGVASEAADLFPRDDELLAFTKAKYTQIKEHDDGDHTARADVDLHVVYVAEALAVANVDNFFVFQIVDTASFHVHRISSKNSFLFLLYEEKKESYSMELIFLLRYVKMKEKCKEIAYGFFEES